MIVVVGQVIKVYVVGVPLIGITVKLLLQMGRSTMVVVTGQIT